VLVVVGACATRTNGLAPAPPRPSTGETVVQPSVVSRGPQQVAKDPAPVASAAPPADVDVFETTVRPVLSRTCAPCHEPGGRMYERLPFDNANVVAGHAESVLKRLKAPADKQIIQSWLDTRTSN
jgi:hypothetical protein